MNLPAAPLKLRENDSPDAALNFWFSLSLSINLRWCHSISANHFFWTVVDLAYFPRTLQQKRLPKLSYIYIMWVPKLKAVTLPKILIIVVPIKYQPIWQSANRFKSFFQEQNVNSRVAVTACQQNNGRDVSINPEDVKRDGLAFGPR